MIAHTIGSVPTEGFEWYIFFLEPDFNNIIQERIKNYISTLGEKAGHEVLVVRGYDEGVFRKSVLEAFEAVAFYGSNDGSKEWEVVNGPAVFVTNVSPLAVAQRGGFKNAKLMIFPLGKIYEKDKDKDISVFDHHIWLFFENLLLALKAKDAVVDLEKLDSSKIKSKIEKYWGWLRYLEMKPNFFGFGVNLEKIIEDRLFSTN